jgi:uncharacterized protein YpuA (DUF1002 family)
MASMHTIQTIFSQNHKNCIANTFSRFLIKFTLRAQSEELIINNLVEQNKYLKDVLKKDYSGWATPSCNKIYLSWDLNTLRLRLNCFPLITTSSEARLFVWWFLID